MCTALISNRDKTVVGWNLDLLDMEHKVVSEPDRVYIAINDATEGWMPIFGANSRGDFVAMPACWPYDSRSDPPSPDSLNIIKLDIDLLLCKKTLGEIKAVAESGPVYSVPGVTFQNHLTDRGGNVLQITPGQGFTYREKPLYSCLTNFSPFKGNSETHPWMGWDRYNTVKGMLERASDGFGVDDCFQILHAAEQTICPTVVSMVFDVTDNIIYWCENRQWNNINSRAFGKK